MLFAVVFVALAAVAHAMPPNPLQAFTPLIRPQSGEQCERLNDFRRLWFRHIWHSKKVIRPAFTVDPAQAGSVGASFGTLYGFSEQQGNLYQEFTDAPQADYNVREWEDSHFDTAEQLISCLQRGYRGSQPADPWARHYARWDYEATPEQKGKCTVEGGGLNEAATEADIAADGKTANFNFVTGQHADKFDGAKLKDGQYTMDELYELWEVIGNQWADAQAAGSNCILSDAARAHMKGHAETTLDEYIALLDVYLLQRGVIPSASTPVAPMPLPPYDAAILATQDACIVRDQVTDEPVLASSCIGTNPVQEEQALLRTRALRYSIAMTDLTVKHLVEGGAAQRERVERSEACVGCHFDCNPCGARSGDAFDFAHQDLFWYHILYNEAVFLSPSAWQAYPFRIDQAADDVGAAIAAATGNEPCGSHIAAHLRTQRRLITRALIEAGNTDCDVSDHTAGELTQNAANLALEYAECINVPDTFDGIYNGPNGLKKYAEQLVVQIEANCAEAGDDDDDYTDSNTADNLLADIGEQLGREIARRIEAAAQ